jgi:hypothetical protein
VLLFILALYSGGVEAQQVITGNSGAKHVKRKGMNLVGYDDGKVHYGFFLGLNYSIFRAKPSQFLVDGVRARLRSPDTFGTKPPQIFGFNPQGLPAFTAGFILNLRLEKHFDFRVLPQVSFYQRSVSFRYGTPRGDSTVRQLNQSTFSFIEIPLLIKYKSKRRNNTRLYMIAGLKPCFEVGAKRGEIDQRSLRTRTIDLTVDYGFGGDFYYPYFKFSPELRFSTGLLNMINPDDNEFANSLKRMTTQSVTLFINFE